MSDTFYMPRAEEFSRAVGPAVKNELNLTNDEYDDGLSLRWKLIKPTVTVKNYTHDIPMDKRRNCETCISHGSIVELGNDHYEAYCKHKCVTNTEFHALKDNLCHQWEPANQDCIG
jgi:hypothetical protein